MDSWQAMASGGTASWATVALASALAYALGSLSFAVIVSRVLGLPDPRGYGSGNPGATNVLRSGHKTAALATLLLDACKGWLPVVLAPLVWPDVDREVLVAGVGLFAFLGHLWPVYFRFQGGKGVATAAGVLIGIHPLLGLATLVTWLIIAWFFRYSSLAALVSAAFAPFFQCLVWGLGPVTGAVAAMGALLVWRHRANITRLLAGTESRLGRR